MELGMEKRISIGLSSFSSPDSCWITISPFVLGKRAGFRSPLFNELVKKIC